MIAAQTAEWSNILLAPCSTLATIVCIDGMISGRGGSAAAAKLM
jgi:hypothetical protein